MKLLDKFRDVKEELLNDERMIGNVFRLDIFYRRYRALIWLISSMIVIIGAIYFISSYYADINKKKYNAIYNKLVDNPMDTKLIEELKGSKLFDLYKFKQALETSNLVALEELSNGNDLIAYLSKYELGSFNEDVQLLSKVDKYVYGDFARIQSAYILITNNQFREAKNILDMIPKDSDASVFSSLLLHYLATKVKD